MHDLPRRVYRTGGRASSNLSLCPGTTPDEAADEIARALWKAAKSCFEVKIPYVCLEDLPWETEIRDQDDFERLMLDQPAA